jgi:hypothetical protein
LCHVETIASGDATGKVRGGGTRECVDPFSGHRRGPGLVSDRRGRSTVSIQVKFSKDFLPTRMAPEFQEPLRVCSFFVINRDKLRASQADFWVFVLNGSKRHVPDFVSMFARELRRRLRLIHGPKQR